VKSEPDKKAKKELDLNILKKPKFYIPIIVIAFFFISAISLILWRPGIARGEYSLQAIMDMLLSQNQRIEKIENQNDNSVKQTPAVVETPVVETKPEATAPTAPVNNKPYTPPVYTPTVVVTPTPPAPIPTCDTVALATYQAQYSAALNASESQFQRDLLTIQGYPRDSSYYWNAFDSFASSATARSNSIVALYNSQRVSIHCDPIN